MSCSEIETKLHKLLQKKTFSEIEVVYIFVELKKYIDQKDKDYKYFRIFRNWIVHTELTITSQVNMIENLFIDNSKIDTELFTNCLKEDFKNILKVHNFDTSLVSIDNSWLSFTNGLLGVLSNQRLISPKAKILTFKDEKVFLVDSE
ncbi:hypothetical protein H6763_03220 [Candidatus Nomurabacteria bacterium]|nr:hypothetical protein [Candidatus Nomurabacteria bacterium]MCB9803817.1 hypothetical protein [Candidatus Nomurabacteria bacterium]